MQINRIDSQRKYQTWPSFHLLYEWEDVLSGECDISIRAVNKIQFRAQKYLSKLGLENLLDRGDDVTLFFEMTASVEGALKYTARRIPIIVDYFLNDEDSAMFLRNLAKAEKVFVTSREAYEYLLGRGADPAVVKHLPLSLPDKYRLGENVKIEKVYDLIPLGRLSPTFEKYLNRYKESHPGLKMLTRRIEDGHFNLYDADGRLVGNADNRSSYIEMLRKARVMLYSTPGYDDDKETNGFSQVTPRFLEALACGCNMIMRYPDNADVRYFELEKFAPSVESYEEFERQMDRALTAKPDMKLYMEYLKKHYTSHRAMELKKILEYD